LTSGEFKHQIYHFQNFQQTDLKGLTNTEFKTFFRGGEYVIAGRVPDSENAVVTIEGQKEGEPFFLTVCLGEGTSGCNISISDIRVQPPRSDAQGPML
jgi:hypothetical protein